MISIKSLRKTVVLILFMCAAAGLMFGGGEQEGATPSNFNATGLPIVDEPVTISVSVVRHIHMVDWNDMAVLQQIEEDTNVDIEWIQLVPEEQEDKINLMFASNDLPDAFSGPQGLKRDKILTYGPQGVLIPMEDLIDKYAPNIKKIFTDYPAVRRLVTTPPDGHIYSLPWMNEYPRRHMRNMFWINQTWLDNLGLETPETTDDFYDVLKAFKEGDPNGNGLADEIPYTFRYDNTSRSQYELMASFGVKDPYGNSDRKGVGLAIIDGKVVLEPTRMEWRAGIEWLHKLYRDGLIDPDSMDHVLKDWKGKTNAKPAVVGAFTAFGGGKNKDDFVPMKPLVGPTGIRAWRRDLTGVAKDLYFEITNANKYPEVSIRWADYLNEGELPIILEFGPYGTHIEKQADGRIMRLESPEDYTPIASWRGDFTPRNYLPYSHTASHMAKVIDEGIELQNYNYSTYYEDYIVPGEEIFHPYTWLLPEQQEVIDSTLPDVAAHVQTMEKKWIVEGGIEQDWDQFIADLKKMGLDKMMAAYQKAYDAYISG
ncbi:MAG: extracellular solute-binding protein [Spirochaetales bacterium]|nr:extracellular solute-binding protein [Spirochaetales bacterium]